MGYVEASGFQGVVWILQMDGSLEPRENRHHGLHVVHERFPSASAKPCWPDSPARAWTQAIGFCTAPLAAESRAAVEPDLRWRGAWASGPRRSLARSTDRGSRSTRRACSGARYAQGASGQVVSLGAVARVIDRVSCRR